MAHNTLAAFSDALAELAAAAGASVVQVQGARRPASGVVHGADTILTNARALGRDDGLRVRLPDGETVDAELAGWDPATGIAVLRTRAAIPAPAPAIAEVEPKPGQIVLAVGRSISNALSVSAGNVAVVGGPLRTGRRREISRVARITAPIHEGFAGGGIFDPAGRLTAIATAATIRGFGVAIPVSIAWTAAVQVLTTGTPRRGFIGVAVQPAQLASSQRPEGRERGLIVVGVTPAGPAEAAGLMVGDVLLDVDGRATENPEDLLDLLTSARIGQSVAARTLRGGAVREVELSIGERTA
jgi:S1-C subfamily serine protease